MAKILVIEDDPATAAEIEAELSRLGHTVECVHDGSSGLDRACNGEWDAMVVDRLLPGLDGLSLIQALRSRGVITPTLVLSALQQVSDRIVGLRAGGDDYLVKPFALAELAARLECLVRRPVGGDRAILHVGSLAMDLLARKAFRGQRKLDLLAREFQLLEFFMRRPDQIVTRQMLLEQIFGYNFDLKTNLVDVHVGRLRRKLDGPGDPPMLETQRGIGFVLRVPA